MRMCSVATRSVGQVPSEIKTFGSDFRISFLRPSPDLDDTNVVLKTD